MSSRSECCFGLIIPSSCRCFPSPFRAYLPKFKAELAASIGKAVEEELLPVETLIDQFDASTAREGILKAIEGHIESRLRQKLPPFLPDGLKSIIAGLLRDWLGQELPPLLDKLTQEVKERVRTDLHISQLVQEKIMDFDLAELEALILRISHRHLRHLEILGGILGFVIGLIQAASLTLFVR